jgi:hypothetical protein
LRTGWACPDALGGIICRICVEVSTMPILPTRKRTHRNQYIQVVAPLVHHQADAKWQLDVDALQGHELQARVDVLAIAAEACVDQAINVERRREVCQDLLLIPCYIACARVHDEHMAVKEGSTHSHCSDDTGHAQTTGAVSALDLYTAAAHDPEVPVLEHPHLSAAIEHKDVRIAPEHASALPATWRTSKVLRRASLEGTLVIRGS